MQRRILLMTFIVWGMLTTVYATPPNIIVILADDLGYGDLGCTGSPNIATPHIDRLADEGVLFTNFYAAPFCGPARASLMTGCYAPRVGLSFNHGPGARTGLNPDEITLPEMLKRRGYATMHIGKWHLGDHPEFLPTRHGFDRFLGLPYSNDMWAYHPMMPTPRDDPRMKAAIERAEYTGYAGQSTTLPEDHAFATPLPLMRDTEIVETDPDQTQLTTRYTEEALDFIAEHKDRPFFLYLAHAMPHVPLFVSEKFRGRSSRGLYGDVVMEVDWSVGRVVARLRELGLDENTVIVFTSDNGPWLDYGIDGGSAGPLRGGKGQLWEGGVRVPAIVRRTKQIAPGRRIVQPAGLIDLYPTLAEVAGATVDDSPVRDGRSLLPLLTGDASDTTEIHDHFYYFGGGHPDGEVHVGAVRDQRWKLHVMWRNEALSPVALYDIQRDVSERFDRLDQHPDIAARLLAAALEFDDELLSHRRPVGRVATEKEGTEQDVE